MTILNCPFLFTADNMPDSKVYTVLAFKINYCYGNRMQGV